MVKTDKQAYLLTLGDLMRTTREQAHLTQSQVAERSGLTEDRTYRRWETGKNSIPSNMLPLISKALASDIVFNTKGEIKMKNEVVDMSNMYTEEYLIFSAKQAKAVFTAGEEKRNQQFLTRLAQVFAQFKAAGYELLDERGSSGYHPDYVLADQHDTDSLYRIEKQGVSPEEAPVLTYFVCGELTGEFFHLAGFVADISANHGQDLAEAIQKALVYNCLYKAKGLFFKNWAKYEQEPERLIQQMPELAPWADVIVSQLHTTDYVLPYDDILVDDRWLHYLGLAEEETSKDWLCFWALPTGEEIEIDLNGTIATLDDLLMNAMALYEEEFESVCKHWA